MHVVVFLGHVPGHVGFVETEGEEEGFVVGLGEFGDAVVGDSGV